jgi:Ca-activated chloride channel family protein
MTDKSNKNVILKVIGLAVAVFLLILLAYYITGNTGGPGPIDITKERGIAIEKLNSIIKEIDVKTVPHTMDPNVPQPSELIDIMPDISKYPLQVNSSTPSYIEIFSSTEKAGNGTDGWLTEVARDFNNAKVMIDGKQVSVRLRGIASGEAADYITSGKYLPDAYTPSNELWGEIIISRGAKAELVEKRLAGNVAGVLLSKSKKDELAAKYGAINITTIVDAVANKELKFGYTNPFVSSTGLNFLISTVQASNSSNPFGDSEVAEFERFQANIPVVTQTTLILREKAKSGELDGFILEYQTYMNTPDIRSYEFIPFGVRHDSPIYAIGELSAEKRKILNQFVEFTKQEKYQTLATKYGFNGLNQYQPEAEPVSGDVIIQAQNLWKDVKNTNICAVFVADVSGSMMGEPLNSLKRSLREGQYFIGKENMIGLVSYSDGVNIDLPLAKFNLTQRAMFCGAVRDLQAGGATATFDGIAVAMKMIEDQRKIDPSLKPMIFLLSDGKSNRGHGLNDIYGIVKVLGTPINTIGYNEDIDSKELKDIASINEAVYIDADTADVVYKLRNMFNIIL